MFFIMAFEAMVPYKIECALMNRVLSRALPSMLPLPSYLFGIYFYSLVGVGENALPTDSEKEMS